jgi:phosphoglycolate phosphatase
VSFGYTPIPMAELLPDILLDAYDELSPDTAAELLARGPVSRQERAIQAAIS